MVIKKDLSRGLLWFLLLPNYDPIPMGTSHLKSVEEKHPLCFIHIVLSCSYPCPHPLFCLNSFI